MTNKIEQFKDLAKQALPIFASAKETSDKKKEFSRSLSWLALQVLASEKVSDEIEIGKLVSKTGPYQALRQCVSKARLVANVVIEKGCVSVTSKKEPVKTFSLASILASDEELFSVATVYNALKNAMETPEKTMTNDDFIALAIKDTGLTLKDIHAMSQAAQEQYVTEGMTIHADMETEALAGNFDDNLASVKNMLDGLMVINSERVQALIKQYVAETNNTHKTAIAV